MITNWLKCKISEGMFQGEYAVQCKTKKGDIFSFFAPSEYVDAEQNLVKVILIESKDDACLIYVPFAALYGNVGRTVKVPANNMVMEKKSMNEEVRDEGY